MWLYTGQERTILKSRFPAHALAPPSFPPAATPLQILPLFPSPFCEFLFLHWCWHLISRFPGSILPGCFYVFKTLWTLLLTMSTSVINQENLGVTACTYIQTSQSHLLQTAICPGGGHQPGSSLTPPQSLPLVKAVRLPLISVLNSDPPSKYEISHHSYCSPFTLNSKCFFFRGPKKS